MSISHDVQVQCGEGAVRKRLRFVPAHATCGDTEVSESHLSDGGLGAGAGADVGVHGMAKDEARQECPAAPARRRYVE